MHKILYDTLLTNMFFGPWIGGSAASEQPRKEVGQQFATSCVLTSSNNGALFVVVVVVVVVVVAVAVCCCGCWLLVVGSCFLLSFPK